MYNLEIIGFNIEACQVAAEAGADRIELCSSPGEGGTTPSHGFISSARKLLDIELWPMIRPRAGDFYYSLDEFELMKMDVVACKHAGVDGIVTGILTPEGNVDIPRCCALAQLAFPMGLCFHRAFDRCADPFRALEEIIECGFERILSSGQKSNAMDGIELLAGLITKASGRISIMPGSGIRADNLEEIMRRTGATEVHSSAKKMMSSGMTYRNEHLNENLEHVGVDRDEIISMRRILDSLPGKREISE